MATSSMRGLSVFISDIRNCQNKEAERARVDKELANIRTHFKSDRALTPYEKKKYVWKLLYIYMLGYEVEFGLVEATALISAPKYAEKQVGYEVTSCLLNENHDFLRLVINTVRNDIISRNDTYQCLALTMVGNVGGKEFAEALALDVEKLLLSPSIRPLVKKKAALCLLRLYRKSPELINPETWCDKMVTLLEERDLGVLLCTISLFITLLASNPDAYYPCLPKCVRILDRLVRCIDIPQDYTYYAIPSPWLQVKVLRALQYFPAIEDPLIRRSLIELLGLILQKTDTVKNVNKNNALHALLFEAMALAMHMDAEGDILPQCVGLLGKFISVKEPNIRYLGLENMARMLLVSDVQSSIRTHQPQIVASLRDPDISIRRRALDLLYGICDVENAKGIVEELLLYLTDAEYAIREELTLKTAVLAEKFAPNLQWYVDVILELTEKAGDFVSDDIWYRVVHIVTNNEDLQAYAASKVLLYLRKPGGHETLLKMAGYILGEFGHLLAQPRPELVSASAQELFSTLHEKFNAASVPTKAILLSAYIKILLRAPPSDTELQARTLAVFTKYAGYVDAEVQQRAVEYSVLATRGPAMTDIMAEMPKFPERESSLVKKAEDTDGDAPEASAVKVRQMQAQSQAIIPVQQPQSNGVAGTPGAIQVPTSPATAPREAPPAEASAAQTEESRTEQVPRAGSTEGPPMASPSGPSPAAVSPAVPAASPPGAEKVGDLLGELLLLDAAPAAGSAPLAPAVPAAGDALALALADGSTSAAAAAPVVQPVGSIEDWFRGLMVKDSGVLYEDPHLQIGAKAEWRGPHGRMVLFLGNKETGPLTAVQASVPPTAGLRLTLGPLPPVIPPRAQIQVPIEVAAVLAPREVPVLNLSYTTPAGVVVPLRLHLPVVIAKFAQPASLPAADFFARWKAHAGPPLKLQEVLRGVRPLPLPSLAQLLSAMNITVIPNLDPNPNNLVAACNLYTETTPPILLLTRIETDPADRTQMRLTVASPEPTATLSLKEFIKDQVSEAGLPYLRSQGQQGQGQQGAPLLSLPPAQPTPAPGPPAAARPAGVPQPQPGPGPLPGVPSPAYAGGAAPQPFYAPAAPHPAYPLSPPMVGAPGAAGSVPVPPNATLAASGPMPMLGTGPVPAPGLQYPGQPVPGYAAVQYPPGAYGGPTNPGQ